MATVSTGVAVELDAWYHVSCRIDPSDGMRFYKDGTEVFSHSFGVDAAIREYFHGTTGALTVGRNGSRSSSNFKGLIDEVVVYDHPASLSEIAAYGSASRRPGAFAYADGGLQPATTYYYKLKSEKTGACGWPTTEVTIATTPVPAPPENLLLACDSTLCSLHWDDKNGSEIGYEPLYAADNATITGTTLEVSLITPPIIPGGGEANISTGYIVGVNRTFVINATVICRQGYCGNLNGTVRYNKTASEPGTNIPDTYISGEAFFIQNGVNTKSCSGNPREQDEWCNITWTINTSAGLNTIWKIDVIFNSSTARSNETDYTSIQVGKILLMDLSYNVIDFGILNPDGEYYLYPAINSSNMTYNVSVDSNSNDIEELWIKGTHLTNGTIDYNRYINVTNVKWARSYLGDHPSINPNMYNLSLSFDQVNKDAVPIRSGLDETMYFWIDAPGGILPLKYTGVLTIMGNASF